MQVNHTYHLIIRESGIRSQELDSIGNSDRCLNAWCVSNRLVSGLILNDPIEQSDAQPIKPRGAVVAAKLRERNGRAKPRDNVRGKGKIMSIINELAPKAELVSNINSCSSSVSHRKSPTIPNNPQKF